MRPVRTRPRFKCDYCPKTLTEAAMIRHESICWNNPDRFCPLCENKGVYKVDYGPYTDQEDCYYCSQYNAPETGEPL